MALSMSAVTRKGPDTTLARIIHLVEAAQAQRAPSQQFVDRFARWYTPGVIALAVLIATVPPLFGGTFETWLYRALVLLVVSCPCALVISTPVSIVSALAGAARRGVLVKGGVHLERLAAIRAIAFDKTGTLTRAKLRVTTVLPAPGISEADLLTTAAAIEARSEHPVAAAIAAEARERRLAPPAVPDVRALPGLGAEGRIGGVLVVCGNARLFNERGLVPPPAIERAAAEVVGAGAAPVLIARDGEFLGVIGVADEEREVAADTIELLHQQGIRPVVMLTGDQEQTARAVGARLGLDIVRAGLLPHEKVAAVQELRHAYGSIAMVGDGVNDAPALAAADVGIAMGVIGSDAALETADVALMTDELPQRRLRHPACSRDGLEHSREHRHLAGAQGGVSRGRRRRRCHTVDGRRCGYRDFAARCGECDAVVTPGLASVYGPTVHGSRSTACGLESTRATQASFSSCRRP